MKKIIITGFIGLFIIICSYAFSSPTSGFPRPNTYYMLVNKATGKALNVDRSRKVYKNRLYIHKAHRRRNQQFIFFPMGWGYYAITARHSMLVLNSH
ncbi:MAG: RICIN domain-containing protein, partial [Thermoplasmatales archaeon]|nr:RICIN domain-containing protein [Thermoplasmatales archaeon]